ncbi:MAG: flagellar basal body rod protein FlgB [Planctomycetota bacterium]
MSSIFYQIELLASAITASEKTHRVHAQNIANVNTPGYKTQTIDFDSLMSELQAASRNEAPMDDSIGSDLVEQVDGLPERVDGNNVQLEKELSALKRNALSFQTYSQLLASRVSTMRRAISG